MTEVDTSIYKRPEQPNILANIGSAATAIGALNNNRLTQQTLDMRAGLGQATAGAVDPTTGQVDNNKLLASVSQDPRTAWNFGDINAQTQANSTATANANVANLNAALAHVKVANAAIASVSSDPRLGTVDMKKQITGAIADIVGNPSGALTAEKGVQQILQIPDDPVQQKLYVQQHANQNLALEGHIESILGAPQAISTGGNTNIVRTPAAGGAPMVAGTMQNTLSPSDAASQVAGPVDAAGRPTVMSKGAYAAASGTPGAVSGGGGTAPAPSGIGPGGTLTTGLGPAEQAAASATGAGSGAALTQARNNVAGSNTRIFQTQKALDLLAQTATGRGTETRNDVLGYLSAFPGVKSLMPQSAIDSVHSYDELNKYLTQAASATAQQFGQGTDTKLATALSSNASTHINNLAAKDVLRANLGLEKTQQAQMASFEASGLPEKDYSSFAAKWATNNDPRAFIADKLSDQERQAMIKSMSDAEKKTFVGTLRRAVKGGFVNDSRLSANAQ